MKTAYRQRPKNVGLKKGLKIKDAVLGHWRKNVHIKKHTEFLFVNYESHRK